MDLQTRLPHLRNQSINVAGTDYAIDAQGVAKNVSEPHATQLLSHAGQTWQRHDPRHPIATSRAHHVKPIMADGTVADVGDGDEEVTDESGKKTKRKKSS